MLTLSLAATPLLPAAIPGAEPLAGLIIARFDTNSDQLIDAGEWQSGIADSFAELDSNSDGNITGQEIDGMQGDIGKETGDLAAIVVTALIKQVILSLDADANKSVSQKEYGGSSSGFFAKLDADSNGSLTKTELAALPAQLLSKPAQPKP